MPTLEDARSPWGRVSRRPLGGLRVSSRLLTQSRVHALVVLDEPLVILDEALVPRSAHPRVEHVLRGARWMFVTAALVTGTAFAQGQMQQPQQQGQMQQQQGAQARQLDESQWVAELMLANRWAADMSKIAENQAVTPSVRQFAKQEIQAHQRFEQQLQQIAQREGIDVTRALQQGEQDMKADFMHAAILTSLAGLPTMTGVNLDRTFLSSVVLSHDLAIDKIQWAVKQVKNPQLTRAIQDELNTLAQHRQQAHRLLGEVAPKVQRGQGRGAPPISR